jgi:polyferredoxin
LAGNGLYYGLGVVLAFGLKDNRAICKYVCPITVPLKLTARWSLLKMGGDAHRCDDCGACGRACPMDIDVAEYIRSGTRVLSTECVLCQTCASVCPHGLLDAGIGLDGGGPERLRRRPAASQSAGRPAEKAGRRRAS